MEVALNLYIDPFFWTKIYWSGRSNTPVIIEGNLRLEVDETPQSIPITIRIPRKDLTHFAKESEDDIIHNIADSLNSICREKPKGHKRYLRLSKFPSVRLKMISEQGISILQNFFNRDAPPGYRDQKEHLAVRLLGFSSRFLTELTHHLPRGKTLKAYPLTRLLPTALLICRQLVLKAKEEAERKEFRLSNRIKEIIEEDDNLSNFFSQANEPPQVYQDIITLYLVQRAFQGAWEAYGHPGLLDTKYPLKKEPQNIFRDHLYGQESAPITALISKARTLGHFDYDQFMKIWERMFLGAPGVGAKRFLSSF